MWSNQTRIGTGASWLFWLLRLINTLTYLLTYLLRNALHWTHAYSESFMTMQPVSRKLANKQTHETKNNASPVRSVHLCPHESNYNAIFHDPFMLRPVYSDTTQLNWTQLNSTRQREQQLTQFVGRDVIKKHDWLGCTLFNWVSWVQLSCVAINTPLGRPRRVSDRFRLSCW